MRYRDGHVVVVGRETVPINDIITSHLPRPSERFNPHKRYRVVLGGGYYRLAESPQGERSFAAARAAGLSTVPIEIIESRAYRNGIFTQPVTCACRPAVLRPRPAPGATGPVWTCECA